ncbi:uncharacterized protein LOC143069191 isoform X2 [Mytilus galloprovincialis]|uniref:uncharacterized protein LOC143069191 isoform X2 n=1 Tax=Mytilus galloprovincialis TaxID=29158 RepID=UPI003F7B5476
MLSFKSLTIPKIQLYLRDRGIVANGYKQKDLASLAEAVEKLNIPYDPNFLADDVDSTIQDRLRRAGCSFSDPFTIGGYDEDFSGIPDFSLYDIFNYLLLQRSDYDKRKLKAYKSAEDYRLFYDGHVQELKVNYLKVNSSVCVFIGKVRPTQRAKTLTGKMTYQCWFVVDKTLGDVKAAYCECPGGADGACRHVAACLYELEAFEKKSVTDGPCQWKKRKREHDEPVEVERMKIIKPRRMEACVSSADHVVSSFDPRQMVDRAAEDEKIKQFASKLAQINPEARALEFLPHEPVDVAKMDYSEAIQDLTIPTKAKYFKDKYVCLIDNEEDIVDKFMASLSFSSDDVKLISRATQGQSSNNLWFTMRKGLITASNFQAIMNNEDPDHICSRIIGSESLSVKNKFQELALDWGRRKESKARNLYQTAHGLKRNKCITETGLVVNPKYPCIGCSPDGVITCKCHESKVIEIKCPFSLRNKSAKSVLHMKTNSDGYIDFSSQYYCQVQGQMGIMEMKKCDLVFYTKHGIEHVEVNFDEEFFNRMLVKLQNFFTDYIAPFLLEIGPHIAAVTLAAYECKSTNFPEPPYPTEVLGQHLENCRPILWQGQPGCQGQILMTMSLKK